MKKLISCLLAITILVSAFTSVTGAMLSVSATTGETVANIDFSEEFYNGNAKVQYYNPAHGNALKFGRVSIATENWGNAVMYAIGDDNGILDLTAGSKLKVNFEIYKKTLWSNESRRRSGYCDFSVGLIYLNDTEYTNVTKPVTGKCLMAYTDRIMTFADVNNVPSTDWETLEGTFTVPEHASDTKPYLVLYSDYQSGNDKVEIWIDNIVMTEDESAVEPPKDSVANIDFSEQDYASNDHVVMRNGAHGKVAWFARISVATGDWGNAVMYAISDDNGSLNLTAGSKLKASVDVYKELLPAAAAGGFSVGLIYLNDTEVNGVRNQVSGKCLMAYANRIMKLADVDGTLSSDWETLGATFTVPEHASDTKPYLVLYASYQTSTDGTTKVWVDNIVITEDEGGEEPPEEPEDKIADIDFSEDDYIGNSNVQELYGTHGKALLFKRISITTADWGSTVMHAIYDDDGILDLTAGSKLKVNFDIYKEKLPDAAASGFSVGLVYLTNDEYTKASSLQARGEKKPGSIMDYVDRMMAFAEVNGKTNGWETLEGTFTVPEHNDDTKPYLVLCASYETSTNGTTMVWIDNIVITEDKGGEEPPEEPEDEVANVDFSEEYYAANDKVQTYGTHGKTLKFNRVSVATADWGQAVMHAIGDVNGSLKLSAGSKLNVSLDINKEKLSPATAGGTDYRGFNIGLVYLNDTEVAKARDKTLRTGGNGSLMTYANRIMKLAEVDGTINGWETVEGTFTVPEYASDATPYLVLYRDYETSIDAVTVWVDNIKITKNAEYAAKISGDVNANKAVNADDLSLLRKIILKNVEYDVADANVNGDNKVDILDLVALKKLLINL